ncbi:3'-5' exoribonuclease YhaM family protein [Anaeromicropila populeti]|uniref:3'-5' exoribonuclease n=1 Tax=Anaeromicropila populeti TaxID=37658 RepID=A0A1I6J074_9FIRM|nr:HD domain-containing protein [Anaeromicropila populeti]SFR71930.1 3'-5' exoribonuclease [Anaeromicropila populeti]
MHYINELREGDTIAEIYLCKSKQNLKTKAGKTYFSMLLQDKTGILDAKIWDLSNAIENFEAMDFIHVEGQLTSFQGSLQLNVRRVRMAQEGEYNAADYMPASKRDINEMFGEVISFIDSLENPYLKKLAQSFFVEDKEFVKQFQRHSAAKSVHHSFMGGLLEHTLGVMKFCDFMASNYQMINRDILLVAALFHDIGKLEEISEFPENDYTNDGQLLGHIYLGAELLAQRIRTIPNFPAKLSSQLRHCILAHHGELEYGSPKKPATLEALALTFADNADAKLETMIEAIEAGDEKNEWVGYNRFFESNICRSVK